MTASLLGGLIALYAVSFALPTWALGRYVVRAQRDLTVLEARANLSGKDEGAWDDFDEAYRHPAANVRASRNAYLLDVALIGTGTAAGAIASVIALLATA
ncbi:hypothetical protein [Demequina phytophila]|uniref:hypothetical protein n=1 Tax=Demequina phytophila TaxID=1638981 RepID=UPI000783313E|nr:hypothetical protein [Demequina phytophila]